MGAPEIDRLEPEPADAREQRVETLAERLERREGLVRRPVAVAPAVHRPAGLARDLVRGHEHDLPGSRAHGREHRGASVLGQQAPRPPWSSPLISRRRADRHRCSAAGRRVSDQPWWRSAAFYQIYVRSFEDSNGDGIGDLPGIRSRLPTCGARRRRALADAVLPLAAGRPRLRRRRLHATSTRTSARSPTSTRSRGRARARDQGHLDIVPNHTSDQHEWFRNAIADPAHPTGAVHVPPGSDGGPPNGWTSAFGGPAWTLDAASGEYYLHFFTPEQPDLDWHHPASRRASTSPPLLARPRRRRLPDRRRARALQGPGPARDGRAEPRPPLRATGSRR